MNKQPYVWLVAMLLSAACTAEFPERPATPAANYCWGQTGALQFATYLKGDKILLTDNLDTIGARCSNTLHFTVIDSGMYLGAESQWYHYLPKVRDAYNAVFGFLKYSGMFRQKLYVHIKLQLWPDEPDYYQNILFYDLSNGKDFPFY